MVAVSVDPYVLDVTASKRRLKIVESDGSLTYEEPKPPNVRLTEELERIWNEYPNGLLDITEEKLHLAESPTSDDVADVKSKQEEMEVMRVEVCDQLNNARNELWFALELAKTLSLSTGETIQPPLDLSQPPKKVKGKSGKEEIKPLLQKSEDAPVLPPGTFSATQSVKPNRRVALEIHDLELALAAKQQAIEDCSALIDAAVEELETMAAGGDKFWHGVRTLRDGENGRGQWAILPKPDFARTGERAQDVVIPYALDEAPGPLRAKSLAAFDLDPTKDALTFGARSFLRLRVRLGNETSAISFGGDTLASKMEAVQLEAFDEDIFNEIRIEGARLGAEVEPTKVSFPIGEDVVSFEILDSRKMETTAPSPICDLIASSTKLTLLQLHRQRKVRTVGQPARRVSVLAPTLQLMEFAVTSRRIDSTLSLYSKTLSDAGLSASITRRWALENAGSFLTGAMTQDSVGCSTSFDIQDCPGMRIDYSPLQITVTSPSASFALGDLSELPHILADEITSQLVGFVVKGIQPRNETVFLDEIDGTIQLNGRSISVTIPPPFTVVRAQVGPGSGETYISGETSLRQWVETVALL